MASSTRLPCALHFAGIRNPEGITRISPDKSGYEFFETDDLLTTNICFGGDDLKTAYITLSSTGRLVKTDWNTPGHKLNF